MIKLGKMTDYAVVILSEIARAGQDNVVKVSSLVETTGLSKTTIAKLTKILVKGKILTSSRGMLGGYALAMPPHEITMKDVITAVEGPVALTSCLDHTSTNCLIQNVCQVRGNWEKVNNEIIESLQRVTIADMTTNKHCTLKPAQNINL